MKKKLFGLAASALLLGACTSVDGKETNFELLAGQEAKQEITIDEAKEIAFSHANVDGSKAQFDEAEYDARHNEYELEFIVDNVEYEYEIDAASGKIVEVEKETVASNKANNEAKESESEIISLDEAKEIAFAHAEVDGSKATFDDQELDQDDLEYELEFKVDGVEYEYDIDAVSGEILKFESEKDARKAEENRQSDKYNNDQGEGNRQENSDDDRDDDTKETRRQTNQQEKSDNKQASEFKSQAPKQESKPAAKQGSSTQDTPKKEKSNQQATNKPAQKPQETKGITSERALTIALNHAGVSSNQISDLEIELDTDDGVRYFEVEFEVGEVEYEYEISADTGAILDVERD